MMIVTIKRHIIDMEPTNISQLKGNPDNPRTLTKQQASMLDDSMKRYGDLSGIIENVTTGQLVGGHQRVELFKRLQDAKIVITERLEQPNSVGTIARGHVLIGDEQFTFRRVRWDEVTEQAANIAANQNGGDFDDDKLANMIDSINRQNQELLHSTGFSQKEIDGLLQLSSAPESDDTDDGRERLTFRLYPDDVTIVQQAINEVKQELGIGSEFSDEANGQALLYFAKTYLGRQDGADIA
jgi:hypothetical protein